MAFQKPRLAKSQLKPKFWPGLAWLYLALLGPAFGLRPELANHYKQVFVQLQLRPDGTDSMCDQCVPDDVLENFPSTHRTTLFHLDTPLMQHFIHPDYTEHFWNDHLDLAGGFEKMHHTNIVLYHATTTTDSNGLAI